jgi:glyoxylase I family protein
MRCRVFKRIDHIEIVPRDLPRSIAFYTEHLGFRIRERRKVEAPPLEEVVYLELGGTVLELVSVRNPASASVEPWQVGYRMMAIEVEDMDRAVERLKKGGVEVVWGPVALGRAKRAEIRDPDGLPIELRQW